MTTRDSRLAIVTGTSRGLGLAIARDLLDRGWSVLGSARSEAPDALDHERYAHLRLDFSSLTEAAGRLEEVLGAWDVAQLHRLALVNNAGVLEPMAPVHALDPESLERAVVINVAAPIWLMGLALRTAPDVPLRIVNIGSGASTSAYPGWAAYCSTKAALRMAAMVLGVEAEEVPDLADRDLAVVDFAPGVVETRMQEQIRGTDASRFPRRERFVEMKESGQLLDPRTPAAAVADLVESDDLPPFSERRFG